jgi:hypothetical protein
MPTQLKKGRMTLQNEVKILDKPPHAVRNQVTTLD